MTPGGGEHGGGRLRRAGEWGRGRPRCQRAGAPGPSPLGAQWAGAARRSQGCCAVASLPLRLPRPRPVPPPGAPPSYSSEGRAPGLPGPERGRPRVRLSPVRAPGGIRAGLFRGVEVVEWVRFTEPVPVAARGARPAALCPGARRPALEVQARAARPGRSACPVRERRPLPGSAGSPQAAPAGSCWGTSGFVRRGRIGSS